MKKRLLFGVMSLALALALFASGCAVKKSSYAESENKTKTQFDLESEETSGNDTQDLVKYKSLIEKYVGGSGMPYRAYYEILKWDDYFNTIAGMFPAEEWLDSDGRLSLPFDYGDIMSAGNVTVAYFYVPDELAVKASTEELVDISLLYASRCLLTSYYDIEYYAFEFMIKNCNAFEESLRREDFAEEYFERYIDYVTDSESVPKYYESIEKDSFEYDKNNMLNFLDIILAQSESYGQLTKGQRVSLLREEIKTHPHGGSYFFACITGKYYMSAEIGECTWEENPWLNAIKAMDFTEDEQKILDKYFGADE